MNKLVCLVLSALGALVLGWDAHAQSIEVTPNGETHIPAVVVPGSTLMSAETLALMQVIDPDYIIPSHRAGEMFIAAALAAVPQKVIRSVVGSSYIFGAA